MVENGKVLNNIIIIIQMKAPFMDGFQRNDSEEDRKEENIVLEIVH